MKRHLPVIWPILLGWALCASSAHALPVSHLEVRIVTGAQELSAGSSLELRIYEAGKDMRRFPLLHGEAWPRDSTHVIPVKLGEALDPRNVLRFSLYYRSASPVAPELDVVSAEVLLPAAKGQPAAAQGQPMRLLDATLSGVIPRQGELASLERDQSSLACKSDADCDDGRSCNGQERCAPRSAGADARGCVKGAPVVCPVNQVCAEGAGCRGLSESAKP